MKTIQTGAHVAFWRKMLLGVLFLLFMIPAQGQTFPDGFNYQAVLRDGSGNLMVFQPMELKIGILSGSVSGPVVYEETHNVNSDGHGYVNVVIGMGTATANGQTTDFSTIDWAAADMFVNLQVDANNNGVFTDFMTTQLFAVPYAMYAKTTDATFEMNELLDVDTTGLQVGYSLIWDGSSWVPSNSGALGFDTVSYSFNSGYASTADSANYAMNAQNIIPSDTSNFSWYADSADYATVAGTAINADTASYADTAAYALNCIDGWNLGGNALAGSEFLGSTNAEDLVFRTNNVERMRITAGGRVGIGTNTPVTDFNVDAEDGIMMTGTLGAGAAQTFSGNRFLWYPRKAHFYAGGGTTNMNDAYMGLYSMGTGYNTRPRADYSFTTGQGSEANGVASFAGGNSTTYGDYSFAFGENCRTYGESGVALGRGAHADGNSAVALGYHPHAYGEYSVVIGHQCEATDSSSFAFGHKAHSDHKGTFVYADRSDANAIFNSDGDNKFMVRAAGGTEFFTSSDLSTGVHLTSGAGAWATVSDSTKKENFTAIDYDKVLKSISELEVTSWNYKSQDDSIRHIGPMAQDFYGAFGYGESDTTITTTDIDGVNLAALQALMIEFEALETEVQGYGDWQAEKAELVKEREALVKRLERLESLLLKVESASATTETAVSSETRR